MGSETAAAVRAPQRHSAAGGIFLSPFFWGGLVTVGFYLLVPLLPIQRALAVRYFCSHPLEYATTTLFFVGMATLALKALRLHAERSVFGHDVLDAAGLGRSSSSAADRAQQIESSLERLPNAAQGTHLVRRIRDVCGYVVNRRSSDGLEEHLKYLAELAAERLHNSFSLVRTVTWAVPILGFLGTVIGITLAIANVTPEQLDTSLGDVTAGLAVAFDTTALALALSLVLVFASFLVERAEQGILSRVEEFGIGRIAPLFPVGGADRAGPLVLAEQQAALTLVERTEALIEQQTELWRQSLEALRSRWTETLAKQQSELDQVLRAGVSATLDDHAEQLRTVRGEFLHSFQTATQGFTHDLSELWKTVQTEMHSFRDEQRERSGELLEHVSRHVAAWQRQLRTSGEAADGQLQELRRQGETLLRLTEESQQLVRLETRLADNLDAVRTAETFEQTLHNLTAAVNLLTARAKPKAA